MGPESQVTTITNTELPNGDATPNRSSWAWVVLLCAFICTAVVDGIIISFGLHLLEMMETATFTTWTDDSGEGSFFLYLLPGAILTGMHLYASPLANVLSGYFDYRPVAIASALFSGLILVISAFLQNLEAFALFFGSFGGLSCGLLYFPSLSIVAQWFEFRRALAVGLAICGSGVGTCVIALCFRGIVCAFSWRGLLIIIGAIFFQLSVLVALFRPVEVQQAIDVEKSRYRALKRRRQLEHERIAAAIRREKLLQVVGQTQNPPRRAVARVRGGIMSRILEEKFRQRSTSTGSLDGMVITRDNKLISLPTGADYELAKAAAVAVVASERAARSTTETTSHAGVNRPQRSSLPSQPFRFSASDKSGNKSPPTFGDVKTSRLPNPRPVVLLGPPLNFSKSGVIRIADAILQKLEAQALIAPGMRCPDIAGIFRRWPIGIHNVMSPDELQDPNAMESGQTGLRLREHSRSPSTFTRAISGAGPTMPSANGGETSNSLYRPFSISDNDNIPALCISDDSGKAGSVGVLGTDVGHRRLTDEECCRGSPHLLSSSSRHLCGSACGSRTADGCNSNNSIDPKTDSAIASELSRVCLDSDLKARIRAVIYHELKHNCKLNSVFPKPQSQTSELAQQHSYSSLEDVNTELSMRHDSVSPGDGVTPGTSFCDRAPPQLPVAVEPPANACGAFMAHLSDTLDLKLLRSPSFLLLSLACTLHMFAFFVPYHILPLFISLEGRALACGQISWPSHRSPVFRVPEPLVDVTSIICTVGVAHLIGRLTATFYIERIVNESSHFQDLKDDESDEDSGCGSGNQKSARGCLPTLLHRLADPMILNIVSLAIGGVSLLCLPLTTWKVGSPHHPPSCSSYIPLRGFLFVLVFLHTVSSALAISLRSVIVVELIGVHHLTPAFFYLLVFQGAGAIVGPVAVGVMTEFASGVKITSTLLSETRYHLTGPENNPLSWAYYTCGLVFLLSALAYSPLRPLSAWETRRYLAKALPIPRSPVASDGPSEFVRLPMKLSDTSFGDTPPIADDNIPSGLIAVKRKGSHIYDRQAKVSTCSRISELSYITFLIPEVPKS